MNNRRKLSTIMVFALVLSVLPAITASAKVKISETSKTITVGKTATIKITGTKKAVKWSVNNGNIRITQKTNKYAKVIAEKKGTSVLKAKTNGKTYKCKIEVNESKSIKEDIPSAENISYKLLDTGRGVIAILKNNNKSNVSLSAKIVYYSNGRMIDASSESNYAFESGSTCALKFSAPTDSDYNTVKYDNYDISLSVEKGTNLICVSNKISVSSDFGVENVVATVKNNSNEKLEYITIAIVFYDSAGNAIGYDYTYADCKTAGSTDYISFDFPYDSNYDTIVPDNYEIFVNDAYTYTWMQ